MSLFPQFRSNLPRFGDEVSLNPQPLPPVEILLNPQPLPPRWSSGLDSVIHAPHGDELSLNPQPLPPRWLSGVETAIHAERTDEVSLNPQPLPPVEAGLDLHDEISGPATLVSLVTNRLDQLDDAARTMFDSLISGAPTDNELSMVQLQSVMAQRSLAISLTTELLHDLDDAARAIFGNIRSDAPSSHPAAEPAAADDGPGGETDPTPEAQAEEAPVADHPAEVDASLADPFDVAAPQAEARADAPADMGFPQVADGDLPFPVAMPEDLAIDALPANADFGVSLHVLIGSPEDLFAAADTEGFDVPDVSTDGLAADAGTADVPGPAEALVFEASPDLDASPSFAWHG